MGNIVGGNVDGFQVSTGFNAAGSDVEGFQATFGLNASGGDLNGFQAAGGGNVAGGSVRGVQAAIGGNLVAQNFQGLQAALGLNLVGKNVLSRGLQAAVGLNVIGGDLDSFQVAGGGNVVGGTVAGVQAAVGSNLAARDLKGWQIAGGLNFVGGTVHGQSLQTAGGGNIAGHLEGTQLSLFGNIALGRDVSTARAQIAAVNIAHGRIGTQIGILNVAGHVERAQIGALNISGRMSGIPIGLINFVKDNPLHLQFWSSDTELANLAIRIGSRHAYSLFMVGSYPYNDWDRGSFGFGMGGHIPLSKQLFLNIDAVTRPVFYTHDLEDWWVHEHTLLNKLRLTVGWEQHRWLSIFGGVSLNVLVSDRWDTSDFGYGFDRTVGSTEEMILSFVFGRASLRVFSFKPKSSRRPSNP